MAELDVASLDLESAVDLIQRLQSANTQLIQALEEKDREIKRIKEHAVSEEYSRLLNADTDMKEARIVELAKKNKSLVVSLEKEKTRCARLIAQNALQIRQAQKRGSTPAAGAHRPESAATAGAGTEETLTATEAEMTAAELLAAKEKIGKLNAKLNEFRQQCVQLKGELQRAHRALVREVGDEVPLQKVLDEGTNWKGRAQKIQLLQAKLKELQGKVTGAAPADTPHGDDAEGVTASPGAAAATAAGPAAPTVPGRARDRAAEMAQLQRELEMRNEEIAQWKAKGERAAIRVNNLEKDNQSMRGKIQLMLDKSANDDKLVDALKAELDKANRALANTKRQLAAALAHPRAEPSEEERIMPYEQLQQVVAEQETQLDRQEQIIKALRREIEQFAASQESGDIAAAHALAKAQAADVEVDRLSELVQMLRARLLAAEQRCDDIASQLQTERTRAADLDKKLAAATGKKTGGPAPGARREESPAALQEKVRLLEAEIARLRTQYEENLTLKDEEIRLCRDLLNQNKAIFDNALQELKRTIRERYGDESELSRENARLRMQLEEKAARRAKRPT